MVEGRTPAGSSAVHQLPQGTALRDRYRIIRVLGQGGFGITYLGHDQLLDMDVAVKEYYPSGLVTRYCPNSLNAVPVDEQSEQMFRKGRQDFLKEARILARFADDPNIVNVRDFFEENNTVYIVMEYLEGESLHQILRRNGPMPFDEVFRMLSPVMDSLARVHENGLVHRDISLSNLMRTRSGRVKLLDFGTARASNAEDKKSISLILTPGFAPEEQYRSRGIQGPWTDVYAMCASIYKMITGKTPESSMNRVFEETLQLPTLLGADITPAQEAVLLHGMSIRQKDRIQSMTELKRDFEQADGAMNWIDEDNTVCGPSDATEVLRNAGTEPAMVAEPVTPQQAAGSVTPQQAVGSVTPAGDERSTMLLSEAQKSPDRSVPIPDPDLEATIAGGSGEPAPDQKPVYPVAPESGADPYENDGKAYSQKDSHSGRAVPSHKGSGRGGKKLPVLIACVIAAVILGIVVFANSGNKYQSSYVDFNDQTVTEKDIAKVKKSSPVEHVSFMNCSLSDDVIRDLGEIDHVSKVSFYSCTGFKDLKALSNMKELNYKTEEPVDYAALLSEKMPQLEALDISGPVADLEFLKRYPTLQSLDLSFCVLDPSVKELPALSGLKSLTLNKTDLSKMDLSNVKSAAQLTTFNAMECGLQDLKFLEGMTQLESLDLRNNAISSLEPLGKSASIRMLYLDRNQIEDLSPLSGMTQLGVLEASENRIEEIPQLSCQETLRYLTLSGNQIKDISALKGTKSLTEVSLQRNQISDISALSGNTELQSMNISYNQVKDLSACSQMIEMVSLLANHNEIGSTAGMENMTQLETVGLSDNQITDVSVLAKSQGKLKLVLLDSNKISSIDALADNPELKVVTLENNQLKDLKGLSGCTGIEYLSAYGNEITDVSGIADCTSMWYLDLGENKISSLSDLSGMFADNTNRSQHVLLQNNQLTDLSALNPDLNYTILSVYGNDIKDVSFFGGEALVGAYYLSWYDGFDAETVSNSNLKAKLVDVPLDQQVNIRDTYGLIEPEFLTKEQADAEIKAIRAEQRERAGIDAADATAEEETAADKTEGNEAGDAQ